MHGSLFTRMQQKRALPVLNARPVEKPLSEKKSQQSLGIMPERRRLILSTHG